MTAAQEHGINSQFTYLIGREGGNLLNKNSSDMHVTLQTIEPKTTFYTLLLLIFYQTFSFLFTVETKKSERIPEGIVKILVG